MDLCYQRNKNNTQLLLSFSRILGGHTQSVKDMCDNHCAEPYKVASKADKN